MQLCDLGAIILALFFGFVCVFNYPVILDEASYLV